MVSASHNPPAGQRNQGVRRRWRQADAQHQALIEPVFVVIRSHRTPDSFVAVRRISVPICCRFIARPHRPRWAHQRLDGVPIVLDLCWGSATACGAEVFQALGADLTVLHGEPDGQRINVDCGSTQLEPLRQAVVERGAAMGFAFDGDADRMLAVDGRGRVVDGDHVLFLWGSVLQEQQQLPDQRLVATVMSNLGFERAWQRRGGLLERTPVGDQHVHAAMVPVVRPLVENNPVTSLPRPMACAAMAC